MAASLRMMTILTALFAYACLVAAAAPPTTSRHAANLRAFRIAALRRREVKDSLGNKAGLDACYSNGSICLLHRELDEKCDTINSSKNGGLDWYKCLCESGWLSTNLACENCCDTYGLSNFIGGERWIEECKSHSLSIAPIPTPILSAWRQYNATHPVSSAPPAKTDKPYSFDIYGGSGDSDAATVTGSAGSNASAGASSAMATATSGGDGGSDAGAGASTLDGFAGQTGTGGAVGTTASATPAATASRNVGAVGASAVEAGWFTGGLASILLALVAL